MFAKYISLKGKEIKYCIGCLACQTKESCVLKDDVAEIMAKVKDAEVIVYATPIYHYEMAGQMKKLLERMNPLYPSEYVFRDIYMIATATEDEESEFAQYFIGKSYLAPISASRIGIFNVTFEPGCRNNWHIHHASEGGGQILICVAGRGYTY